MHPELKVYENTLYMRGGEGVGEKDLRWRPGTLQRLSNVEAASLAQANSASMAKTAWLVVILFVGIRQSFWNPGPTESLATMRTCAVVTIGVPLILAANCFRDSARAGRQRIDVTVSSTTLTKRAEAGFARKLNQTGQLRETLQAGMWERKMEQSSTTGSR